ncbi:DUF445 domain-containing protein [Lottiidibacillus patelloidae]|nr:DUF445 family protein [Lottiidibacillus patelloidae]
MNELVIVIIMVSVGALIGGFTNALAIKMLFRPHLPRYIGKWKVPFTPGLIPKRRSELAEQLGKTVVKHLITKEAIAQKLNEDSFQRNLLLWLQAEVRKLLCSNKSVGELFEMFSFDVGSLQHFADDKIEQFLHSTYEEYLEDLRNKSLGEVLPHTWDRKVDTIIPPTANLIADRLITYFQSSEGKSKLGDTIDKFLSTKGMLGSMVTMFLGNERVVDKVQPEVIKFLQDEGNRKLIETIVQKEWTKLKEQKVAVFESLLGKETVKEEVTDFIKQQFKLEKLTGKKLKHIIGQESLEAIIDKGLPKAMQITIDFLERKLEPALRSLNIENIVKTQVESFSLSRLEEMVLDVSRKELKMITLLGAVLGGFIGLIQGVMLSFFN